MSVVIVGGNECMVRPYKDLCAEYGCKAKIYPKMNAGLRDIGTPDLLILFTNTVSHKMVRLVLGGKTGPHPYRPLSFLLDSRPAGDSRGACGGRLTKPADEIPILKETAVWNGLRKTGRRSRRLRSSF